MNSSPSPSGVAVQGIFLRRQAAVARIYARIIASKALALGQPTQDGEPRPNLCTHLPP